MIVSHSKRFVFVKTRKTASTSIEVFLHPELARHDIWTPLSEPKVRGNGHYSSWPFDVAAAKSKHVRRRLGKHSRLYFRYLHDHAALAELYRGYGRHRFARYFRFCFDRNPWDYVVSLYHYETRKADGAKPDFETFVHTHRIPRNWDLYTIHGRVAVDAVYRYEELETRMAELAERLGLGRAELPRLKSHWRPGRSYRDHYTPATRDRVAAMFAPAIEHLGYDF